MPGKTTSREPITILPYSTFYFFATALAAGIIIVLPLVPIRVFGRRFFLLVGLAGISFYVLAMVGQGLGVGYFHLSAAGFLVFYEITLPGQPGIDRQATEKGGGGRRGKLFWVGSQIFLALAIVAAWCGIIRDTLAMPRGAPPGVSELLSDIPKTILILNAIGSALLIGFALVSMILGHWYLVSKKLPFRPLRLLTGVLCLVVLFRAGTASAAMRAQGEYWSGSLAVGLTPFLLSGGLFVACRLLLGILLPGALAFLAWRCARIESNQSATGILYVLVAFVFFGEILSKHFLAHQGIVL